MVSMTQSAAVSVIETATGVAERARRVQYEKLVSVARTIMHSDFASMQQYFPHLGARGELKLIGHYGFSDAAARFWAWVRADSACTCGVAIVRRERVIASDVENTAFMAGTKDQEQLLAAGIRAAQTTPLLSRRGELVGTITTHWKTRRAGLAARRVLLPVFLVRRPFLVVRWRRIDAAQTLFHVAQADRSFE
jgi:hypothetical protein